MKCITLLYFTLFLSLTSFSQQPPPRPEDRTFEYVEIEVSFPGGEKAWRKYLQENLNATLPIDSGATAGTYQVIIQFIVNKEGTASDFKPLTNHGFGMEAEVLRILRLVPKWVPANVCGRNVKAYKKQTVTFVIAECD